MENKYRVTAFILVFLLFAAGLNVYSQDSRQRTGGSPLAENFPPGTYPSGSSTGTARGDGAVAERYAQWAKDTIEKGQWKEGLAALERASDFADVSSDISYLLALARSHENKPRGTILEALKKALYVNSWNIYDAEAARLLMAEQLIVLRAYQEALHELSMVKKSPREAELSLRALVTSLPEEFRRYMTHTLDRYPRECGPVRVFFDFLKNEDAAGRNPGKDDLELLELVIRRLPALLLKDPELAWIAAPFMRDSAEAKRLVSAYRAINKPLPSSLPAALRLGAIDEETALEELFASSSLDKALVSELWDLLRREEAREYFRRNLLSFTGVITEDADRDGFPEISVEYAGGMIKQYTYDADQDGHPDLTVFFEAGDPRRALTFVPPENSGPKNSGYESSRREVSVRWERYPAVLEAELNGARFVPRPFAFNYSPLEFAEMWGSGLLFPKRDALSPPLTRRILVMNALRILRPSLEFSGGTEVVELAQGIPIRAREYVLLPGSTGDLLVSETEFVRGRPQLQRLDLDLDGHIDTVRHFRRAYRTVELEELWDYDRNIDYTVKVSGEEWGKGNGE